MNKFFPIFFLSIIWISQLDARLYYIHIPKTGGSTIRTLIESKVHLSELYPRRMPKREKNQPEMPLYQEIVSGHFPLWFCDQIDENFDKAYKFTVLRDPVDRYLSFLRYRNRNNPNFTSLEHVLETISQTDDRSNLLCKFLANHRNLTGQALLQNAKENIHRFDFIVFFDSFAEDVQNLCHLIGIDLKEESLLHLNTTNPESVSPELMQRVIQINELDIALYEYAKNNYSPKTTSYQFHSPFYSGLMIKKKNIDFTFHMPHKGTNWCYREKECDFSLDQNFIYRYVMDVNPLEIFFNLEENE